MLSAIQQILAKLTECVSAGAETDGVRTFGWFTRSAMSARVAEPLLIVPSLSANFGMENVRLLRRNLAR
jgi:hypothetical protein